MGIRVVDEFQAEVVRRIFLRFTETRSFSAVSNELNDSGIPPTAAAAGTH